MKKIIYATLAIALGVLSTSCSVKEFLTRKPINEFSAEQYFASEADLEMYANGMVNSWLPDNTETNGGDAYNDLIATKTSTDYFRQDIIWDDSKQSGWESGSWSFHRRVNYMLDNMVRCEEKVAPEVYAHYRGVARFWRAYQYWSKVKNFSNVPWVDHYIQPDEEDIIYGGRLDREEIFNHIAEDLLYACENCGKGYLEPSRAAVNYYLVNAIASRIFLYEGTFRRNFPYNPATGKAWKEKSDDGSINYMQPTEMLQHAKECAANVMDGTFAITDEYADLFLNPVLNSKEVIWGRTFILDVNGRHSLTRYFHSSTLGQQYSGTKDLINHFTHIDGTPVTEADMILPITKEFLGRDARLAATVLGPGHEIEMNGEKTNEKPDFTFTKTGYQLTKWCVPDNSHFQNSLDENSLPALRYAEVLLNYAEACNELGEDPANFWNATVGELRKKHGKLTNTAIPATVDPWLKNYYTVGLRNQHITEGNEIVALEIRRERVTELTFESELRQNDIIRYGQADLVARRAWEGITTEHPEGFDGWRGIYLSAADVAGGFKFEGASYKITGSDGKNDSYSYPVKERKDAVRLDWYLSEGDHGYLIYKCPCDFSIKKYVRPIPNTAKTINPNLGENYLW